MKTNDCPQIRHGVPIAKEAKSAVAESRLKSRILIPIFLAIGTLHVIFAFAMWHMQRMEQAETADHAVHEIVRLLHAEENDNIAILRTTIEGVMNDGLLSEAFRKRDSSALLERAKPLFNSLRSEHGITHFYFHLPDRIVLLRVHDPATNGDKIDRQTLMEAERTGKVSIGIERGVIGVFTLRVVAPWRQDGRLIGYIELGVEFERLVQNIHKMVSENVDILVAVDKKYLDHSQWSAAVKLKGRPDDWNRFPRLVVINKTVEKLPKVAVDFLLTENTQKDSWRDGDVDLRFLSLTDVNGKRLGELIILQNATQQMAETRSSMLLLMGLNIVVGATLAVFFYFFLTRVEKDLTGRTQMLNAEITERKKIEVSLQQQQSELRVLFDLMPAMVWFKDTQNSILRVNKLAAEAAGKNVDEIEGKPFFDIYPQDDARFYADDLAVMRSGSPKLGIIEAIRGRDGKELWIQTDKVPYCDKNGHVIGIIVIAKDITECRRIEQELKDAKDTAVMREGEQRYSFLADAMPLIIWTARPDGGLDYYNKVWFDYTGLTLAQTQDWGWRSVLHLDDLQPCIERWTQSIASGNNYEIEYRFKRAADGTYRWFLGRASARRDKAGNVLQWVGTCTDINDKKCAEGEMQRIHAALESRVVERTVELSKANEALRIENAERKEIEKTLRLLDSAVMQSKEAILITDAELDVPGPRIIFVNPAFTKMTGFTPEEALGKTPRILQGPHTDKSVLSRLRQTLERGEVFDGEVINYRQNGEKFILEWQIAPIRNSNEKITHFVSIQRDITERKRAEEALRESNALLETLLKNTADGIYFKDMQSRFVHFSRKMLDFFHLIHPDELKDRTDFDFFSEEHARPAFEGEQEIIRTGIPIMNVEEKETHIDGRITWVLTSKMPWRNKTENIIGTFGISKDITAIKESQAKLEQLHKQLLEASRNAGMAEVATNVLHNVGNVLNSVNIASYCVATSIKQSKAVSLSKVVALLREHEADLGMFLSVNPQGKQIPGYLGQLAEHLSSERASTLAELAGLQRNIEHIKEIVATQQSYATSGGVKEIINVVNLVEDSICMNEVSFKRHRVEVIREFANVPPMNVEKHKILQIMVNLLHNAEHACVESSRTDKRLTVLVTNGNGQIKISVIDNGVGIPPENLLRIFNHGFTTRKDGHGFGLHSGALAAKEMGGSLTVQSDGPGQGAAFTLELPCTTNEDSNG